MSKFIEAGEKRIRVVPSGDSRPGAFARAMTATGAFFGDRESMLARADQLLIAESRGRSRNAKKTASEAQLLLGKYAQKEFVEGRPLNALAVADMLTDAALFAGKSNGRANGFGVHGIKALEGGALDSALRSAVTGRGMLADSIRLWQQAAEAENTAWRKPLGESTLRDWGFLESAGRYGQILGLLKDVEQPELKAFILGKKANAFLCCGRLEHAAGCMREMAEMLDESGHHAEARHAYRKSADALLVLGRGVMDKAEEELGRSRGAGSALHSGDYSEIQSMLGEASQAFRKATDALQMAGEVEAMYEARAFSAEMKKRSGLAGKVASLKMDLDSIVGRNFPFAEYCNCLAEISKALEALGHNRIAGEHKRMEGMERRDEAKRAHDAKAFVPAAEAFLTAGRLFRLADEPVMEADETARAACAYARAGEYDKARYLFLEAADVYHFSGKEAAFQDARKAAQAVLLGEGIDLALSKFE